MSKEKPLRLIKVGTFVDKDRAGRRDLYTAYTLTYNPSWPGCIEYEVLAKTGTEAKRLAIEERKAHEAAQEAPNE